MLDIQEMTQQHQQCDKFYKGAWILCSFGETRIMLVTSISPGSFRDMCPLAKQDFLRHSSKKKKVIILWLFLDKKKNDCKNNPPFL